MESERAAEPQAEAAAHSHALQSTTGHAARAIHVTHPLRSGAPHMHMHTRTQRRRRLRCMTHM